MSSSKKNPGLGLAKRTTNGQGAGQASVSRLKRWFKNDRFAAGCRIELLSMSEGRASARMMLSREHWNSVGTVMGGAIFTLADFAFAAAANSHANVSVAINANIAFMKAAWAGTLWAEAWEISKNYKLGSYAVEIRDDAGDLVAIFQGMAYRKSEKIPV